MPQHRRRSGWTARLLTVLVVSGATVTVLAVVGHQLTRAGAGAATGPTTSPSLAADATTSPSALTATATPAAHASPTTSAPATETSQRKALARLVDSYSAGSVSVAALDTTTGTTVQAGAASGMYTASVAKVQLLETLLLEHQQAGTSLSDEEEETAESMIEHSDNEAADSIFWDVGGRASVVAAEAKLGISSTTTVPGSGELWGLTRTSAADQLTLLTNLTSPTSPLDAASRSYALDLMRDVEADQRWGTPAAADSGTDFAVKNGWLSLTDEDGGRWAVNSLGVLTVKGHTMLIAVLTQHNESESDGIALVQSLAEAAAAAVLSG
jgi:beta-lactamase class A